MKQTIPLLICLLLSLSSDAQEAVDLFIWAGQSNAQGWTGDAAAYPVDDTTLDQSILLNWTFFGQTSSAGEWVPMQAQAGRYPAGHFGPEVSFSRELKRAGYHPAIFKYCLGATGLARDWKAPGAGGIYDHMVEDLQTAIAALKQKGYRVQVRGFIWIQGESDAGDEAAANAYGSNLQKMIDHLRTQVLHRQDLKILLGVDEQHAFVQQRPVVVEAQKNLANQDPNIIYTSMYGLPKADATHLTPAGLVGHGKRIFSAFRIVNGDTREASSSTTFADQWEFRGIAVEEAGYNIWGSSPILGDDGKVHLFVARWPCELKVDPGWRTHSEIAHYIGDSPEGPFVFSDVAIGGEIGGVKGNAPHNPAIHKVDGGYALFYIANDGIQGHPANQYICLAVSESLDGPWKKAGEDGVILRPPSNPDYWNHAAGNGVNNPAFLQHPDGGFFLYFKSEKARMGLAVAENLEGPYVQLPFPVTANDRNIEDGYAFMYNGKFALLTTDNHGMIESGGGILWTSEDGIRFDHYEKGFHRINAYTELEMNSVAVHYGPQDREYAKLERPQLLLKDGKPWYLYAPSGSNIYGGDCTVSYVLRYKGE
ncbi:sialate O-acetylesterase [Flavilitoribacter nigricans]|uniref:Sialate O-acetylesterase domain-containing protein n=1 Tax=Flavilitoribacter nigricans (strain ATCC 23147 / DSM 23189 / NBRC 102662 / NCIMB 1420 / SS-2) TaxID=1122177 RepID=A0A2D0N2L9_FLAN2|nr:sialate O-acetylesterase [Flavilitoribacter nigricans]PHN02379.1 hypothetical protein CRP01_32565 [Flavilitoribacter nigricans DSM 23189 = NBRC 102662]